MNILLVSSKYMPEYSGSGYRAHNLYKRLSQKNPDQFSVQVLTSSETENESKMYEYEGFQVNQIAAKPFPSIPGGIFRQYMIARNFQSEFKKTHKFLSELSPQPDLIHIFGKNYVAAAAWIYAQKKNIPLLVELCNEMKTPLQYIPFPQNLWLSSSLPENYHFVSISESLRKVCLKNNIPDKNIWCRPNPVEESLFFPVAEEQKYQIRSKLSRFFER